MKKSPKYRKYADMLTLYLDLGTRFREFAGLIWDDFHEEKERPYVIISRQVTYEKQQDHEKSKYVIKKPKTDKGHRLIVLTETGAEVYYRLKKAHEQQQDNDFSVDGISGFLFLNSHNKPYTSADFNSILTNIVNAYNREEIKKALDEDREPDLLPLFSCRCFRRTAATRADEVLTESETIDRIGHTNINTTREYYISHGFEEQLAAAKKLDEMKKREL